jgi:hypothetical protein
VNNKLLKKLKETEKIVKNKVKKRLHVDSPFGVLSDEEICLVLAFRAKELRLSQKIKQKEFSKNAALSSPSTYSNFEQKGTVSLLNFVKIMKNFGRVHELENLLKQTVAKKIETIENNINKRVR